MYIGFQTIIIVFGQVNKPCVKRAESGRDQQMVIIKQIEEVYLLLLQEERRTIFVLCSIWRIYAICYFIFY